MDHSADPATEQQPLTLKRSSNAISQWLPEVLSRRGQLTAVLLHLSNGTIEKD